jgi:hypothetical protein
MGIEYGVVGLLILVLDVWAIIKTMGSSATDVAKLVWVLLILLLPVLGLIAWLIAGPKSDRRLSI